MSKIDVRRDGEDLAMTDPGIVGAGSTDGGGNSGFQALNLAAQFGAAKIILVGFDMRLDCGVHWHGRHARGLNNPSEINIVKWRRVIDRAAPTLKALGIQVINASPISALMAYPVMSFEEALAC